MSKWTIGMPDGWKPEDCERCPLSVKRHCGWAVGGIDGCPLSHAVEATANADLVLEEVNQIVCSEKITPMTKLVKITQALSKYTPVPAPKEVRCPHWSDKLMGGWSHCKIANSLKNDCPKNTDDSCCIAKEPKI